MADGPGETVGVSEGSRLDTGVGEVKNGDLMPDDALLVRQNSAGRVAGAVWLTPRSQLAAS